MTLTATAGVVVSVIYGIACFGDSCGWGNVDECPGNCPAGFNIPAVIFASISTLTAGTTLTMSLVWERYGPLC